MVDKVLLLGSNGQVGNSIFQLLELSYNTTALCSQNINYHSYNDLQTAFDTVRPNHVINCVAYTDVDGAERAENRNNCDYLNHQLPQILSELSAEHNAQLIHFSTDYVFDGTKSVYVEEDEHNPLNFYGKCKSRGDESLRHYKVKNFRVQCVYSGRNKNFYRTIDNLANTKESINVIHDQITCPTHSDWIAEMVYNVMDEPEYGTFNLNPDGNCSFAEFAEEIVESRCMVNRITTEEYLASRTKRPKNGVLDNTKFKETFKFSSLPDWRQVFKKYK